MTSVTTRRDERMPHIWLQFASISLEEGSYDLGLNNFEFIRCPGYVPSEHYIQQFVYLALARRPTQEETERLVNRKLRSRSSKRKSANEFEKRDHSSLTDEKMANSALKLLHRLLEMQADTKFIEDEQKDHLEFIVNALPSYKQRRQSRDGQIGLTTKLAKGAAEIDDCQSIWQTLRLQGEREGDDIIVDENAWGFFDFLVTLWETQDRLAGKSSHLLNNLRDFKHDISEAIDAILAGFETPIELSPLSCSTSVGFKVRQDSNSLFDSKIASESLQRRSISSRLLSLLLKLVVSKIVSVSALTSHFGSALSEKEVRMVCDVMNAFPLKYADVQLDVIISIVQASGVVVDRKEPAIIQILKTPKKELYNELKLIAIRNAIRGKSPSLGVLQERKSEIEKLIKIGRKDSKYNIILTNLINFI